MSSQVSPIDVYKLLPKTNCKRCGEDTCMAFAIKCVNRETAVRECLPMMEEEKHKEALQKLTELLRPAVREVTVGTGERAVKLGGKTVLYRHEYRYDNPTVIAIDVIDEMSEEELISRVKTVGDLSYVYIGQELRLNMVALRSTSGNSDKFSSAAKVVVANSTLPLMLCSLDPKVMEEGLSVLKGRRPLIFAANESNWVEMTNLAQKYDCPLVVSAPNNLKLLKSLVRTITEQGVSDLVLDPGTFSGPGLVTTIDNFAMCRRAAIKKEDKLLGFPLLATPIVAWADASKRSSDAAWEESYLASTAIMRYADIMVLHSLLGWVLLPNLVLRHNIYNDPRKPVSVKPGLVKFGNPDENSPVLVTSNFALTYYTVANDIEASKIDCYLVVIDTEGIAVEPSVAGRKLTADKVAQTLKDSKVESMVKHRRLLIPGKAARLKGEIEEATGWETIVGPMDSSDIQKFMREKALT